MRTPLLPVTIRSIYEINGVAVPLPRRMALCTPDMKVALSGLSAALKQAGGALILSDMFRSYDMQLKSHLDWKSGRKSAYSPPPGGSLHEAGRALDLDLGALKQKLAQFWPLAGKHGLVPIIATPDGSKDEAWHFECRGSHALVEAYYAAGKGDNFAKPYQAMAASAIVSVGVKVDRFGRGQAIAYLQSALIRLGKTIGNIDGSMGPKTRGALTALGIAPAPESEMIAAIDRALQQKFPGEFLDRAPAEPARRAHENLVHSN